MSRNHPLGLRSILVCLGLVILFAAPSFATSDFDGPSGGAVLSITDDGGNPPPPVDPDPQPLSA